MKFYYGQAMSSKSEQFGTCYGVLDSIEGYEDKELIVHWSNGYHGSYWDKGEPAVTDVGPDKLLEAQFRLDLPSYHRGFKQSRIIMSNTVFKRVAIVYEYVNYDLYAFIVALLEHGVPVRLYFKYKNEVINLRDCMDFRTLEELRNFEDVEHTYECDFLHHKGYKLPYPSIETKALTEAALKNYVAKVKLSTITAVKANLDALGYPVPDGVDDAYYKYKVGKSFLYFLGLILPDFCKVDKKVHSAYAYFATQYFAANLNRYYSGNSELAFLRREVQQTRRETVIGLNHELASLSTLQAVTMSEDKAFAGIITDGFRLLDYLPQSEMFFGPSSLNKELASKGEATLWQAPNQLGYRTTWDYRDYADENSESEVDGASYLKSLDSMSANKNKDSFDMILLQAEQTKLTAAKYLYTSDIDWSEFLSDGYLKCKHCSSIYKTSDFELTELEASDDPEYKLFGDWATGYNDAVTSEEDEEFTPVVREQKNPLDELLCPTCQSHLTFKMLYNLLDVKCKRIVAKQLQGGMSKKELAKIIVNIL